MKNPDEDSADDLVELVIHVDRLTVAWLAEVADGCHAHPSVVAGAILRDVRIDDQESHAGCPSAPAPDARLH